MKKKLTEEFQAAMAYDPDKDAVYIDFGRPIQVVVLDRQTAFEWGMKLISYYPEGGDANNQAVPSSQTRSKS